MTRASVSIGPPAAKGTTIVMGRAGQPCAFAVRDTALSTAAPADACRNFRRAIFIAPSRYGEATSPPRCWERHICAFAFVRRGKLLASMTIAAEAPRNREGSHAALHRQSGPRP